MSMLNTKDIKVGGAGLPKLLQPGNNICKLNNIELETFRFKEGAYHLMLQLEGPDLGTDFEGFFIDKDNESKGRHKGQIGQVKISEWAFADGETKTGIPVHRDVEILKALKSLAIALDFTKWLDSEDGKHATIESLVTALNVAKPFLNKTIEYCIGGKEYINKGGYMNHELFLPRYTKAGAPYGKTRVIKFNPDEHIRRKKVEPVNDFASEEQSTGLTPNTDFSLD